MNVTKLTVDVEKKDLEEPPLNPTHYRYFPPGNQEAKTSKLFSTEKKEKDTLIVPRPTDEEKGGRLKDSFPQPKVKFIPGSDFYGRPAFELVWESIFLTPGEKPGVSQPKNAGAPNSDTSRPDVRGWLAEEYVRARHNNSYTGFIEFDDGFGGYLPDGTTVRVWTSGTDEGRVYVEQSNGGRIEQTPDGTFIIVTPSGTRTIKKPDGTKIVEFKHRIITRTLPGGTMVSTDSKGNQTVITPKGDIHRIDATGMQHVFAEGFEPGDTTAFEHEP